MTDTEFSLGEIERLVAGHHHDPHSILGAHPGPEGVVVRALRPVGASVTVILDDGRRFPMTPLGRGVFTATLPEEGGRLQARHRVSGRAGGGRGGGR
jgi:1,4-alpha-glucan branching enzyme